jgi:hypothetical protein
MTSGNTQLSLINILKLTISFCIGTVLVLLLLCVIAEFMGKSLLFPNQHHRLGYWRDASDTDGIAASPGLQAVNSIFNFFKVQCLIR